ncbi:PhzF family phenazine biosynthesis protein [Acidiphilium sp. 34-64-41]|uniref:PhzF family phenazine biosynthesis protein n=1 Tax=Acidiphilium sp. 34-64-41 TaxID=1970297 RepID=UPI000BD2B249|nr:PhzF family phenazine biosynthesis protein [Acidiphilium sp. 34-64-41]OZB22448.1 MAG: hypothetical protein B7X49_17090 [Acidiphilium sp. 34-64-41]
MKRRFATVDVFTDRVFGGNPLAIVLDAEGLSSATMQAIAKEFNYSETTFVLPPADPANTANVRIFNPVMEMPFAGHPNVGTGFWLARQGEAFGRPLGDRLVFEELAGLVPITAIHHDGNVVGADVTAPKRLMRGETIPVDAIAACLGLDHGDIVTAFPPLARGLHVYVWDPDAATTGLDIHCRMFAPLDGIAEDPATGSANAALAALIASTRPPGDLVLRIAQGDAMGRPSRLRATVDPAGTVTIGGTCVVIAEGHLSID